MMAEWGVSVAKGNDLLRVSGTAWDDALADPDFRAALEEGLADLAAGRTRPWAEVAQGIEQHPVEDPLDDPNHQAPDTGLPEPVSGNDDTEEAEGE